MKKLNRLLVVGLKTLNFVTLRVVTDTEIQFINISHKFNQ